MTDADHAFYEFSDVLHLPGYFGWNWDALSRWASPLGRPDGKGVPFKVLLLCDRGEEAALLRQEISCAVHNMR
jgi:Barstar (barnase inhibitor)